MSQLQRTVAALELMDDLFLAHTAGEDEKYISLLQKLTESYALESTMIRAVMLIGQIPDPAHDYGAWSEYLELMAMAEAADPGDDE